MDNIAPKTVIDQHTQHTSTTRPPPVNCHARLRRTSFNLHSVPHLMLMHSYLASIDRRIIGSCPNSIDSAAFIGEFSLSFNLPS